MKKIKISEERLYEVCERFEYGITADDPNEIEIFNGKVRIGIAVSKDSVYNLDINPKYENLFR